MSIPASDLLPGPDMLLLPDWAQPDVFETAAARPGPHQTPHLAFPIRFHEGLAVTVEQDSPVHMRDRVHVTVRTLVGQRLDDPTFGIPDDVLRVGRVDLDTLADAIELSEPDVDATIRRLGQDEPSGGLAVLVMDRTDRIEITIEDQD